ncbi:MAG: sulfatase [Deltaproteobacteria bacterium]|nr:sulfatase [Deltaproteobacteria bacterium]
MAIALMISGCDCGGETVESGDADAGGDAGLDASKPRDAGHGDASGEDVGTLDVGVDAGSPDAAQDAGISDAGGDDSGVADAGGDGGFAAPNIVFVLADDQRADSARCMPKLKDLIGSKGVTFDRNYATTPLCCPGRSSILTGRFAHNHGVLQNGDTEEGETTKTPGAEDFKKNGNEELIFAKWLRNAGYRTGFFGKYLNGYDSQLAMYPRPDGKPNGYIPPHWDEWHVFPQADFYYFNLIRRGAHVAGPRRACYLPSWGDAQKDIDKCTKDSDDVIDDGNENYSTDVIRDMAVEFIHDAAADRVPFFLYFAPKAPHAPHLSPDRYQLTKDKVEFTADAMARLADCDLYDWPGRPASFMEADVSDKPEWVQRLVGKVTAQELDDKRRLQLASVLANEDALEAIVGALEATGLQGNTVLIYTADNGYAWGEHWYHKKNCAYEEVALVPLYVLDPRHPQNGGRVDVMTLNVDLAPTFADLAGVPIPPEAKVNGLSLKGLIQGTTGALPRDRVIIECWGGGANRPDTHAAARSARWKYVEHYDDDARTILHIRADKREEIEFYDLQKDSYELDNLAWLTPQELQAKGYAAGEVETAMDEMQAALLQMEVE